MKFAYLDTAKQVRTADPIWDPSEQSDLANVVISSRTVDGHVVVVSRYLDSRWRLSGQPTNKQRSQEEIDFESLPEMWRPMMKSLLHRYMTRGRAAAKVPTARSVVKLANDLRPFLLHLSRLGVSSLGDVTPMTCATYVDVCKRHRQSNGRPLKPSSMAHRFAAIEALHDLSQHLGDPMPTHPWPGSSYHHVAGATGRGSGKRGGSTPLMPDDVFTTLYQRAWSIVERAPALLELRDELSVLSRSGLGVISGNPGVAERQLAAGRGWPDIGKLREELLEIRTACYIVVASLSGCRNHELAFVKVGACYSTEESLEEDETQTFWWMRSRSTKTGEGSTEWMVPVAAVTALEVMDWWAIPYQTMLKSELEDRRAANPLDPMIPDAERHLNAVFLAATPLNRNQVRTVSGCMMNLALKGFASRCGLTWRPASHQFRRKFANYAARSQFGDLRYLREHFKHWSLDMTLGYALNNSQEMDLYAEINEELASLKTEVVEDWLRPDAKLAGGYGRNIVAWRGDAAITLFKDHKQMVRALADSTSIRSNGHSWCTANDNLCIGNDLERTRCGGCDHAVIGLQHVPLYQGLHSHLREVLACDDIGAGALTLVKRDMDRCSGVLATLGHEVITIED